jgi:hypothetical protein
MPNNRSPLFDFDIRELALDHHIDEEQRETGFALRATLQLFCFLSLFYLAQQRIY